MEHNPDNSGLLYVGKDDNLSYVYIVPKKFIQENYKFWVTVRFVLSELSQFYQNTRQFLKDLDCKYEILYLIEQVWEFAPQKNSVRRLTSTYKGPGGEMIYKMEYDDPEWIHLIHLSQTRMIEQVFDVAISQLVDKDKLYPKQEQIKSSSLTSKMTPLYTPPIESRHQPSTFEDVSEIFNELVSALKWVKAPPNLRKLLSWVKYNELEKVRKEFGIPSKEFHLILLSSLAVGRKIVKRDYNRLKKLYPDYDEKTILMWLLIYDLKNDIDWSGKKWEEVESFVERAMEKIDNLDQLCTFINKLDYPKNQIYYESALSKRVEEIIG